MVRVYVVDHHPMFLQGLAVALTAEAGLRSVGMAGSLEQALEEAPQVAPDVMLLDMALPGHRGADTITALRTKLPQTRLVGIGYELQPEAARQALAAGAAGYLLKSATADELQAALLAVSRGQVALAPALREALAAPASPTARDPHLTRRERDLLGLLARGLGNQAIAVEMAVSIHTVKFHVTNVLWKLQADNRTAAVVKAVQQQIVSL
ncbi:MAG: response regulator transcription factor [Pseudomonadota bacterium]|nr:response regulator transcription factor [Pseudomonadota bacterium]